jgi:hypothetical protein
LVSRHVPRRDQLIDQRQAAHGISADEQKVKSAAAQRHNRDRFGCIHTTGTTA